MLVLHELLLSVMAVVYSVLLLLLFCSCMRHFAGSSELVHAAVARETLPQADRLQATLDADAKLGEKTEAKTRGGKAKKLRGNAKHKDKVKNSNKSKLSNQARKLIGRSQLNTS